MSLSVSPILSVSPPSVVKSKKSSARELPEGDSVKRKVSSQSMSGSVSKKKGDDHSRLQSKAQKSERLKSASMQVDDDDKSFKSSSNWVNGEDSIDVDVSLASDKSLITKNKNKSKNRNTDTAIVSTKKGKKRSLDDSDDKAEVTPEKKTKKRDLSEFDTKENKLADNKTRKTKTNAVKEVVDKVKSSVHSKKDDDKQSADKSSTKKKRPQSDATDDGESKKVKPVELSFKERKELRRKQNKNYDCAKAAVKIWEKLRIFDQSAEDRRKVCQELFKIVKGNALSLINAHDTARVVQTLIKYGTPEQRNVLFDELKAKILEMTKSVYAKFIVRKILKYGTKGHRDYVFNAVKGHVRKLIRHKEAADIIECAYDMFANAKQRASMVEEFYGSMFAILKTEENHTLEQVLAAHPDRSTAILNEMAETLSKVVEKNALRYSFVHKLFLDYFSHATDKLRAEMIETVKEGIIHMVHTREGARVGMICVWHGTAKDRKAIVKSFKEFILKICKEEYGHLVMLALFDVVDDTKLVQKAILDALMTSVDELARDQFGRKVLLYLLSPRDPLHFHPDIVGVLQQGDKNVISKKDAVLRRQELLTHVSRPFVQWIVKHFHDHVLDNAVLLLILSVVQHVKCDPTEAMRTISLVAAKEFTSEDTHLVEHPAGHLTLKKLIANDAERIKHGELVLFSNILLDVVPETSLPSWTTCNRGCFIIISLLEIGSAEVAERVKKQLKSVKSALSGRGFKGAEILLKKLNA